MTYCMYTLLYIYNLRLAVGPTQSNAPRPSVKVVKVVFSPPSGLSRDPPTQLRYGDDFPQSGA